MNINIKKIVKKDIEIIYRFIDNFNAWLKCMSFVKFLCVIILYSLRRIEENTQLVPNYLSRSCLRL